MIRILLLLLYMRHSVICMYLAYLRNMPFIDVKFIIIEAHSYIYVHGSYSGGVTAGIEHCFDIVTVMSLMKLVEVVSIVLVTVAKKFSFPCLLAVVLRSFSEARDDSMSITAPSLSIEIGTASLRLRLPWQAAGTALAASVAVQVVYLITVAVVM